MLNKGHSYTENELGEKIHEIEKEIRTIFRMAHIPLFFIQRANLLFAKWKVLNNWKEDDTPPNEEALKNNIL